MTGSEAPVAVRLVVVDDHRMFVDSVVRLLGAEPGFEVVGTAGTAQEGLDVARRERPDVVVLDQGLPDGPGTAIVARLRSEAGARVLLLTGDESDAVLLDAIRAGCEGYVLKTRAYDDLAGAVRALQAGGAVVPPERLVHLQAEHANAERLTRREMEVLALVAEGHASKEIALQLGLTLNTVRNHAQHINEKLGAHNKTAAVAAATRRGLLRR